MRSVRPRPSPAPKVDEAGPKGLSEEEKAVLAVDEAFVRDYNKGDSKALAALFAEDAEVIEAEGERFRGRKLIEDRMAEGFAASPGAKIAIETDSILPLSPDVVKEEGRSLVTPAKGAPVESAFTALYVKREGKWLLSSVREETIGTTRPHDRLKAVEWMVGEWAEERPDSVAKLSCRWSDDGNYLLRTVKVKRRGRVVMDVSQRIGWDAQAGQIRSWDFDSSGGFGEGRWSRGGDHWIIKHTGIEPDGTPSSSTNLLWNERPDRIRWVSTDRVVGEDALPDAEAAVLVRVPPTPDDLPGVK